MEYTLLSTPEFTEWFVRLRDSKARTRIQARIDRFVVGLFEDVKFLREGVWEIRVDYGPGYRIYFSRRKERVLILLAGGDKRTQRRDIDRAVELAGLYGS